MMLTGGAAFDHAEPSVPRARRRAAAPAGTAPCDAGPQGAAGAQEPTAAGQGAPPAPGTEQPAVEL
ncbi:hypothetical protein [Streptomyces sp. DW26H14]|uniref:hypothetical protein n=1 Tax=Streptomyces sp. DW26H14 TaxID=3435395 RepID=UPI00403E0913